jgi:hypothetical protein
MALLMRFIAALSLSSLSQSDAATSSSTKARQIQITLTLNQRRLAADYSQLNLNTPSTPHANPTLETALTSRSQSAPEFSQMQEIYITSKYKLIGTNQYLQEIWSDQPTPQTPLEAAPSSQ